MKLISMSCYGSKSMYLDGAIENAKLLSDIYPGWKLRVYCDSVVIGRKLKGLGCQVITMGKSKGHSGMLWRFLPAWEKGIERVIFRDTDSRFNVREAAAVQAWIESKREAHCMHDHKHHGCLPIFGGMWGVVGSFLRNPNPLVPRMDRKLKQGDDMRLLAKYILPQIHNRTLRHSSVPTKKQWGEARAFPEHDSYTGFVGQQFDNKGRGIWP